MLNNEPNKVTRVSRMESSEAKKQSCKIRIAVLELRKEQLLR
jgi:hypothetical protein